MAVNTTITNKSETMAPVMDEPGMNSVASVVGGERLHYMDNVRALAMMVGVLFHAALAYSPLLHNMWPTASNQNHAVFDMVSFFTHLFRMPVFFVISGFFAVMLIKKRGLGGFLKNRGLRIVVPFLIFLPLCLVSVGLAFSWALEHVEHTSPVLAFVKMMSAMPDAPPAPISTMHLWFLYYLTLFVVLVAVLSKLKVLEWKFWSKLMSAPFVLILLPMLLVPALFSVVAPHPAPEQFIPDMWAVGFYGLFFLVGVLMFSQPQFLAQFDRVKHFLLLVSIGLYAYFYSTLPVTISPQMIMMMAAEPDMAWSHLPVAIAEAYASVYMTLYCLIMGKQLLNKKNKLLRLISNSSYWIYLIHVPLLFLIQFYLLDSDLPMVMQFVVSCGLTVVIGLVSYLVLVKHTPIGWLLNGRKKVVKGV